MNTDIISFESLLNLLADKSLAFEVEESIIIENEFGKRKSFTPKNDSFILSRINRHLKDSGKCNG